MRKTTRHRIAIFVAFTVLVLLTVPHGIARSASSAYRNGVDVSHVQNDATINATGHDINWGSVRLGEVDFAYVKATDGQAGNVSDVNYDSKYLSNMENGHRAGLRMGAYHYAEPVLHINDSNDAAAEANWFVDYAYPSGKDYLSYGIPPALDLENDFCQELLSNHWTQRNITDWVLNWMHVVENRTHTAPVLYTSEVCFTTTYFDSNEILFGKSVTQYDVWVARYDSVEVQHPPPSLNDPYQNWNPDWGTRISDNMWGHWSFWQYSSQGSSSGISGNVDLDYVSMANWNQASTGPILSWTSTDTMIGLAVGGMTATIAMGQMIRRTRFPQP